MLSVGEAEDTCTALTFTGEPATEGGNTDKETGVIGIDCIIVSHISSQSMQCVLVFSLTESTVL